MPLPIFKADFEIKPHISFSEAYSYFNCPYNRYLTYVEKKQNEETIYTHFGKQMGLALEKYKKNGAKNAWIGLGKSIFNFIIDNEWAEIVPQRHRDFRIWVRAAIKNFHDTIIFLDEKFPNWEIIDFEYPLYEDIPGTSKKFKGFIDIIFKYNNQIWILDFKTSTKSWDKSKRSDTEKLYQVSLYKEFYCMKNGVDPDIVNVGYLLLLREKINGKSFSKNESSVEMFEQTSGKVKRRNAINWLKNQADGIDSGIKIMNTSTCKFCQCGKSEESKKWENFRKSKKNLTK